MGCVLLNLEVIACSKADGTEHRLWVNGESQVRLNRRADDVLAQVIQTTVIVDDFACLVVIVEGVDGQVAAERVVNQVLAVLLTEVFAIRNTGQPL